MLCCSAQTPPTAQPAAGNLFAGSTVTDAMHLALLSHAYAVVCMPLNNVVAAARAVGSRAHCAAAAQPLSCARVPGCGHRIWGGPPGEGSFAVCHVSGPQLFWEKAFMAQLEFAPPVCCVLARLVGGGVA